ncbi:hypothetical protein [Secundilactobacillus similis]
MTFETTMAALGKQQAQPVYVITGDQLLKSATSGGVFGAYSRS